MSPAVMAGGHAEIQVSTLKMEFLHLRFSTLNSANPYHYVAAAGDSEPSRGCRSNTSRRAKHNQRAEKVPSSAQIPLQVTLMACEFP